MTEYAPVVPHGWRHPQPLLAARVWFLTVTALAPLVVLLAALTRAWVVVGVAVLTYAIVLTMEAIRSRRT